MDQYLASIMIWPLPWAPAGWLFCQGQQLPVSQYQALYSLIGNIYGGDTVNFNLPNLKGTIPVGAGQAASGTIYQLGQKAGVETVTLTTAQIPAHTHPAAAVSKTVVGNKRVWLQ